MGFAGLGARWALAEPGFSRVHLRNQFYSTRQLSREVSDRVPGGTRLQGIKYKYEASSPVPEGQMPLRLFLVWASGPRVAAQAPGNPEGERSLRLAVHQEQTFQAQASQR